VGEWFDGPQTAVHDELATRLTDLPASESDWLFDEATRFTTSCVRRIDIVRYVPGAADVVENSFPGSC
jgi:hypothetical protein